MLPDHFFLLCGGRERRKKRSGNARLITEQLNDGDQNMISGVKKFIKSYVAIWMQQSSVAPAATIFFVCTS